MDAELQQVIVGGAVSIVSALIGYFLIRVEGYIKAKTGLEIEAYHRDALHRALTTGARAALSKIDGTWDLNASAIRKEIHDQVKAYIQKSVPDAISKLNPTDGVKDDLVNAAIEKVLAEVKAK